MAFKMNGWSAFTKNGYEPQTKSRKDIETDIIPQTEGGKGGVKSPTPKLEDPSLDPTYEGATTEGNPMAEGLARGAVGFVEGTIPRLGATQGDIPLGDIHDPLADDDAEIEEEEIIKLEQQKSDDDAEKDAMEAAADTEAVDTSTSKFPEYTGEVKDKGRWRQRRQRRKELRDAGMSRKEARIQAREDIGKKWGKHKA